jgi:glycosyltransferase involved in cell wall biosynthesis
VRYRRLFATASLVTAPSEYIAGRLESLGCPSAKLRIQRYGIRLNGEWNEAPSRRFDGRTVRFLFVGRLTRKKAPVDLLESFARARAVLAPALEARLVMVGDGPLWPEVDAAIARLGIGAAVELPGRLPHEAVLAQYRSAQVYVQHSVTTETGDQEGLPVSITEAMAAGLPVISTRHSGIPEAVLDGRTGLLVEEHDVEAMAVRMVELGRNPTAQDRMGAAGRQRLEAEFSMAVVQARLRALLAEAAGESPEGLMAAGAGISTAR